MSFTPLGVTFHELENSPRVKITQEEMTGTREFLVPWLDAQAFALELMGGWTTIAGYPVYTPPIAFPGFENLLPDEIEMGPLDESPDGDASILIGSSTNTYEAGAQVTVSYKTRQDDKNGDKDGEDGPEHDEGTYLAIDTDVGIDYMTTPGRMWKWPDNKILPPDTSPGILIPTQEVVMTWSKVLIPPWALIRQLRGKINSTKFYNAPAGTVLFSAAKIKRQFQFAQNGFFEIEYHFIENSKTLNDGTTVVGWNYTWRPDPAPGAERWQTITGPDGNPPYQTGDLNQLFKQQVAET